ncbi:uncharacterized protein LOC106167673 [Lingula anatina]|nr:uncharacterized protein LOC106167673 [Lingula anatina]|eukprot:XP_013401964.1 uncharacterized protein LOC106167673 [Lingula anatina]
MGIRKKILDGVHEVHKKDWEQGSLPTVQYSRQLSCTEAVAVLANLSKHADYIGCTVAYIKEQIKEDPKLLQAGQQGYGHQDMCKHTDKAIRNTQQLYTELNLLRESLAKVTEKEYQAPDLITTPNRKRKTKRLRRLAVGTLIVGSLLGICFWKRDSVLDWISNARDQLWTQ